MLNSVDIYCEADVNIMIITFYNDVYISKLYYACHSQCFIYIYKYILNKKWANLWLEFVSTFVEIIL